MLRYALIGAAVAAASASIIMAYLGTGASLTAVRLASDSAEAARTRNTLIKQALEARADVYEFALTGNEAHLAHYRAAVDLFDSAVKAHTRDRPEDAAHAGLLARLVELFTRWRDETAEPIITEARSGAPTPAAMSRLHAAGIAGQELGDELRSAVEAFNAEEDRRLVAAVSSAQRQAAVGQVGALAGPPLVIVFALGLAIMEFRRASASARSFAKAARELAAGDPSSRAEVEGSGLLATMATTFNAMADQLAARNREADLQVKLGEMLQVTLTDEETYGVVRQMAAQLFPERAGAVHLLAPSRSVVELAVAWGAGTPSRPGRFAPEMCWALRLGRPHLVQDTRSAVICQHFAEAPPDAYLCIPLLAHGETLGLLTICARGPEGAPGANLGRREERVAVAFSEQVAAALANLRLRAHLRNESIRDPLTGLYNRRYLEETLEREVRRADRAKGHVGLMMCDLDHFKRFNDAHGHLAGDMLLRELGALLQASFRGEDIASRYGGEEFVITLPGADAAGTLSRAEALREAVKRLRVAPEGGGQVLGPVSISIGAAVFPDQGRTGAALLQVADAALYQAKSAGRDSVVMAT